MAKWLASVAALATLVAAMPASAQPFGDGNDGPLPFLRGPGWDGRLHWGRATTGGIIAAGAMTGRTAAAGETTASEAGATASAGTTGRASGAGSATTRTGASLAMMDSAGAVWAGAFREHSAAATATEPPQPLNRS